MSRSEAFEWALRLPLAEWLSRLPSEARVLALVLLGLYGAVMAISSFLLVLAASASWSEISNIEPKIARMKGYQLVMPEMSESLSNTTLMLDELAFNAAGDGSKVGAELQQVLRGYAEEAGLTVSGSQLVKQSNSDDRPDGFLALTVDLRVSGAPESLDQFLRDVYESTPVLTVSSLNAIKLKRRRTRSRRNEEDQSLDQTLDMSIEVAGLAVSSQ